METFTKNVLFKKKNYKKIKKKNYKKIKKRFKKVSSKNNLKKIT